MRIISCLLYEQNFWFVALAALMCAIGSHVTISLFRRALETAELPRLGWVFLTSVCAGAAVWATHFVAMLGYRTAAAVTFDPLYTILSIIIAIFGTGLGFGIASFSPSRAATIVGGGVLGLGISAMHYTGMFGYRVRGLITWDQTYVSASVATAVVLSVAAVISARRRTQDRFLFLPAAFLAAAIVGLHFTGMAAFRITPMLGDGSGFSDGAMEAMALSVAVVGLIIIGTGISSYLIDDRMRARSNAQLFQMAFHDPLTGLANRRALKDQMDEAFRTQTWFKLLLIDLDHFKSVNDTYGHAVGDGLLIGVADRLRAVIGPDAFAYRIGGDELAVVVFKDRETAVQTAHDIVAAMRMPITVNEHILITGCSVGICAFENADDGETLMQRADIALYEAKRQGRNQVFRYAPGMLEAAASRSRMEGDLKTAIEEGQFRLLYQPIIDLKTDRLIGYEALIRWAHPVQGMVSPSEFIPLAEENGSIIAIGKWVIEEACRQAMRWPGHLHVAVNVSAMQFKSASFLSHVTQALASTGLLSKRLEIELTETAMVADGAKVAHALGALRILGVKVAMDDFGTGYSSLTHLRDLPLDRIKIDRSFVMAAVTNPNSMAVLKAITQLGRDMNIPTLGEGVETEEQLQILRDLGCDAAQGYLLGRPASLDAAASAAA